MPDDVVRPQGPDQLAPEPPRGRDRWEVRVEEGPPHGGLDELEQETFFHVVDRATGGVVQTFVGQYEASFTGEGSWGDGLCAGVRKVVIDEEGRCAFAIHANRMVERFALTEEPVPGEPEFPWRLAGLPLPALPMTVDGFVIDEGIDFALLLSQVASGWAPEQAEHCYRAFPATWLCDLFLRLNGLPLSSALAAAVAQGLDGDDDALRGLSLCFYRRIPHAPGRERVLEVVRARGSAEAVRTSPVRYERAGRFLHAPIDVFAAILDTRGLDAFGNAVLQACGEALLAPTTHFQENHLEAIARHARLWIARNAPAVVRACPARLAPLLGLVMGRKSLLMSPKRLAMNVVNALVEDPEVDRRALEACLVDSVSTLANFSGIERGELEDWLSELLPAEQWEVARQRLPRIPRGG